MPNDINSIATLIVAGIMGAVAGCFISGASPWKGALAAIISMATSFGISVAGVTQPIILYIAPVIAFTLTGTALKMLNRQTLGALSGMILATVIVFAAIS